MPGLFEHNLGIPAPKGPGFQVGAVGRSPLSWKRGVLAKFLPMLMAQRQDQAASSAENAQFETMINTSGLSEDEKARARMARNSPALARIFEARDAAKARAEAQKAMQEDRQAHSEEMLRERQAAKDEAEAMKKEGIADYVRGAEASGVEGVVPLSTAPNATPVAETQNAANFLRRMVGGLAGVAPTEEQAMEAVRPHGYGTVNRLHPTTLANLQKYAPQSPVLRNAMNEQTFLQQQERMKKNDEALRMKRAEKMEKQRLDFEKSESKRIEKEKAERKKEKAEEKRDKAKQGADSGKVETEIFNLENEADDIEAKMKEVVDKTEKSADGKSATKQVYKVSDAAREAMGRKLERIKARVKSLRSGSSASPSSAPSPAQQPTAQSQMRELELQRKSAAGTATPEEEAELDALEAGDVSATDPNGAVDGDDLGMLANKGFQGRRA